MSYKHLDYLKRCKIQAFVHAGYTQQQIADELGVHKSTISRELNRNLTFIRTRLGYWTYKANYAQKYADDRQRDKPKYIKVNEEIKQFIREKISQDWSPEQISGYAKRKQLFSLSHEWIYQFILTDKKHGGSLFKHLRHQQKKYRKRYGGPKRQGPIRNRRFIDERPKIVDEKARIGDWEIDTLIGKNRKHAVVSIVERKTKFTILKKVNQKTAENVSLATIDALKPYTNSVLSITADNGSEFAYHEKITEQLNSDFFFAHPYSSWERGLNENTNGLVRQYLKKGASFESITDEHLKAIMEKLNDRPRKTLGFKSPAMLFLPQTADEEKVVALAC
ncbi:IS30B/C/D transposase [Legionella beliardensis]|uniref:IS30B/C/D transposase n=1 Tax=Legionella beliardensis TaxID=91822 RepID=A0A378JPM5_9GAMM|nr:IS30 family transposase [Legionella beliardensis]STX28713.1 IS30B/C/D transposase [Legionella beliardensis]STX55715.1 IS30B/C/D transposase [Legionella beliardensis]STX55733.1 IS30B/C/D transposase [Legionella beliardensis]STX55749.1 IS30B/C/D transposase [Legionella beliardensis]STX55803.1 IS30B/C/D transposase [Legionella beliardensis]